MQHPGVTLDRHQLIHHTGNIPTVLRFECYRCDKKYNRMTEVRTQFERGHKDEDWGVTFMIDLRASDPSRSARRRTRGRLTRSALPATRSRKQSRVPSAERTQFEPYSQCWANNCNEFRSTLQRLKIRFNKAHDDQIWDKAKVIPVTVAITERNDDVEKCKCYECGTFINSGKTAALRRGNCKTHVRRKSCRYRG